MAEFTVWFKDNQHEKRLAATGLSRRAADRLVASFQARNIPAVAIEEEGK